MTKILFVGGMFFENSKEDVIVNAIDAPQNAANLLQWNYIKGLSSNLEHLPIDIINAYFVGWYPKHYKKCVIKKEIINVNTQGSVVEVGFINFPILNTITKKIEIKKEIKKWINRNDLNKRIIISYGFFEENIEALSYAKHLDDKIETAIIIPDLPEFMSQNSRFDKVKKIMANKIYHFFNRRKKYIDAYALITVQMASKLNVSNYVIIEGMVDDHEENEEGKEILFMERPFIFMYSGGLYESVGIKKMMMAYEKIENDCQLWIFGDGELRKYIENIAARNTSVKYFGVVPQKDVQKIQKQVDCLINPREDNEFTKYSFPSKNMEYLLSGTPVIAKRLEGMPIEYKDYIYEFDTYENLMEVMMRVLSKEKSELQEKGQRARKFVLEQKNRTIQTKKLLDIL